jgi:dTMP kinase
MTGKLISLEGIDGSGKGTQADLLVQRLQASGHQVTLYDFPRYGQPSAYFVEQYLKGRYPAEMTGAYQASVFYAVDRYEAALSIRKELADGVIVIANRFTTSSLAHQGGKITDTAERQRFISWVESLEYEQLGIPQPSKVIILQMPAAEAQRLVDQKTPRPHLEGAIRDLHEADLAHLQNAAAVYQELAKTNTELYGLIECYQHGTVTPVQAVHKQVWQMVLSVIESKL